MENKLLNNHKSKSFGIYEAALATLLFIVFNVVFMFLYGLMPVSIRANKAVYFLVSFLVEFLFAVVSLTVAGVRGINFFEANGLNKKINLNIVFYGFLISIVSLVAFGDLTSIFLEILSLCGYKSVLSDFVINTFWEYLIYVVVIAITPAVCEEILFRGTILSGLKSLGFKISLVVSAIIFMLMHGNPEQTIHQFIIGLIVGYLFLKSGNVWLGVIVHFFNNFIAVTQIYLLSKVTVSTAAPVVVETSTVSPWLSLLVSLVIALIVAYFGYLLIKLLFKKMLAEDAKINGSNESTTNATILIDGKEVEAIVSIDGEAVKPEAQEETQEQPAVDEGNKKKNEWSLAVIVMFSLAGAYLVFEWLSALFLGIF